jgi:hypothetical protein
MRIFLKRIANAANECKYILKNIGIHLRHWRLFADWHQLNKGRLKRGRHDKHGDFLLGFLGLVLENLKS